jgi:hypothetical protein
MTSLATPLALIEFFGAIAIVAMLVVSLVWRRHLLAGVLIAAIVFGIVLENPVGVVAEPSPVDARSLTPTEHADGARHWVKVGGVPVAWFTPYDQPYPWAGLYENTPTSVLKLRYGLAFLPSIGASSVIRQCSNYIGDPCWRDRADDYPLIQRNEAGGAYVVPLTQTIVPSRQSQSAYVNVPHVYAVGLGVASWRALAYWLLVAAAIVVGAQRAQLRARSIALAVGLTVLAGLAVGGAFAVVPEPARSAYVAPELLPEPADTPPVSGAAEMTPIETYADNCVRTIDGVARNTCARIEHLTAAESSNGILAIWTAEADGLMHLRTRRLSLHGEPLGAASATVRSWRQTDGAGHDNCEVPAELEAVRLASGDVLLGYSRACDLRAGGSGPVTIMGTVLSPSGALVREPFPMLSYVNGDTVTASPRFWLRSTSAGAPILIWQAPARTRPYGQTLDISALDTDLRAGAASEFAYDEHGFGSLAVACKASCLVAQGEETGIVLRDMSAGGRVLRHELIGRSADVPRSELVVTVGAAGYVVGWIESDGVNVDGYLANVVPSGPPVTHKVAEQIPAGDGMVGRTPDPLGIAATLRKPALVFETGASADAFLLHSSSDAATISRTVDVMLGDSTIINDVLVAIGGVWPTNPSQPVSVVIGG